MLYRNTKWLETVSNVTVMREVINPLAFSSNFTFQGPGLPAQMWSRVTSCLVIRSEVSCETQKALRRQRANICRYAGSFPLREELLQKS